MHGFYMKVEKEKDCWKKSFWLFRWQVKVFTVVKSVESLALTLSYFSATFMSWSVKCISFQDDRKL